MTKFILPSKLINMRFCFNGKFHKGWDLRPHGKAHIKRNDCETRCGRRLISLNVDWEIFVRVEDICKPCLKETFRHWVTVELEL